MEHSEVIFDQSVQQFMENQRMGDENIFSNAYQWQPTQDVEDTMPSPNYTIGLSQVGMKEPSPPSIKKLGVLEKNLLQLLGQFQEKGIPIKDIWKYFKRIYGFEPLASKYGVRQMNEILPKFQENIGIDYSPSGPRLVLTKRGEDAYMKEFHPEDISTELNCAFDSMSGSAQPQQPDSTHYYVLKQMSYSQVATSSSTQQPSSQQKSYIPQTFRQQIFQSNGYKNIKPLTSENLVHAIGAGKPKERGKTVKEMLDEPPWSQRFHDSEEQSQHSISDQDVIQAFSAGLSELEAGIQKNIITILAGFHQTGAGVPVRSIWGLYKKQYKSVPTKEEIRDIKLKSINQIFERFSPTIMRKSVEGSMNFVLTKRGVEFAERLNLIPKNPANNNGARPRFLGSSAR